MASRSSSLSASSLVGDDADRPYLIYAISSRPPGSTTSSSAGSGGGGANARDPVQVLCPYTGSCVTSAHPLRVPSSSSNRGGAAFGVRCLVNVPMANMMAGGGGGDDANATVFVGHGGSGAAAGGGAKGTAARGGAGTTTGKDDHAFLVSRQQHQPGGGSNNSNNPRWKVRPPESLSSTSQSMAVSPCGRFLAAGSTSGACYLWEWTGGNEDNLVRVWKAHYRPVTCLSFDGDDGGTLFTAGEDGVVNAWCLLDLVDRDDEDLIGGSSGSIHPFGTWSEHHLPVTSLRVLPGGGRGSTRLASCSLDRNLVIMELGAGGGGASSDVGGNGNGNNSGARTLARMCLPSGLHALTGDSSGGRLYAGGADGNVYCVDLSGYALRETLDGAAGTLVNANHHRGNGGARGGGDFESLLSGAHALPASAMMAGSSSSTGVLRGGDNNNGGHVVSELRGHAKAVTSLALLDPANLASSSSRGGGGRRTALLASGSDDGTLRVWDLNSRSCVRVLRPWAASSSSKGEVSPPVTAIVAVPRPGPSSLSSSGGTSDLAFPTMSSSSAPAIRSGRRGGGGSVRGSSDLAAMFRPLKRFVRGTSGTVTDDERTASSSTGDCNPILWPRRDVDYVKFWEEPTSSAGDGGGVPPRKKKARRRSSGGRVGDDDGANEDKAEIVRLRQALEKSQAVVERWQAVNNQLVSKLKKGRV